MAGQRSAEATKKKKEEDNAEHVPLVAAFLCYFNFAILITFGRLRDFFGTWIGFSRYQSAADRRPGVADMFIAWENFYTNRIYHRVQDVFNRPVASAPGARIDVVKRVSYDGNKSMTWTDETQNCLNLGSYNYLGFADDWMGTCSRMVLPVVEARNVCSNAPSGEYGTTPEHEELEALVAEFVGKPAAIVYNMGYGTNAASIPALMGKGTLIISDALNHTSIVNGARASGASVAVFKHNNASHLEVVLRTKIAEGQPRTHRPWKKIFVIVEGIYSMEGEICKLREIVDVAKKYRAYMYVDEAHSIGALGATGRGVCEYTGVDPSEIDILMGTFTKSFGGMGGYIAASKDIIHVLKTACAGHTLGTSLSPVITAQVLAAFKVIMGRDGTDIGAKKLTALRENSNFLRQGLMDIGVVTLGQFDSPVIPVMLYSISKIAEFSRQCLQRDMAVVTVGFPATPLLLGRVRFCVSAAHSRSDLEAALKNLAAVASTVHIRFEKHLFG
ncbi:serine palmitoyltransferase [Achlya hypogyna]|uniref:serine C-palmitoyltransferase n=1 Tax=Achlya hypogyna TaxID=1202772 RepID=A0A1V9YC50_ACHHY|nr:serine palmitoyltransferase [Achlya hypogyna]